MKMISAFFTCILMMCFASGIGYASGSLDQYSRGLVLSYPDDVGNVAYRVNIRVVAVHPHVVIHYFKDEAYMFLQHGKDSQKNKYYHSILYPVIGMKTYVTPTAMSGPIAPRALLDQDSLEILDLQLSEIERHGGVEEYIKMLEKRGWFEP